MKLLKNTILFFLVLLLLSAPALSLAESDYEAGDGWYFQDGKLGIIDNDGLTDFISNFKNSETGEWKYQHSIIDVDCLVIGKNVTALTNEVYEWGQITPAKTTIESGNPSFIIMDGWVVNTKTKTLYGAADVVSMQSRTLIDDIPDQVEHIGDGAFFDYRKLTSISLPKKVVSIGERSFMWCKSLSSFEFPEKLSSIGSQAFEGCDRLNQIFLDQGIGYIGSSAFAGCNNIQTANIRNTNLTSISSDLFGACYKLQIIELPVSISKIEELAFRICYELNTLIINSSDLVIEGKAFSSCDELDQIVFTKGTPKAFGESLFGETDKTTDGKSYISDSSDRRGDVIPYPTLYYTAAYADEWAPNGETEWSGYTIQQISQEELDAILAEARGEEGIEASNSPALTATPETEGQQTETAAPEKAEADAAPVTGGAILLAAIGTAAVSVVVVFMIRNRKIKR